MSNNEEAIKKAIEAGISSEQIAADLADDGVLNNSNITGILHEEKDLLDKAQEKAEKIKALIMTIIPIIALLAGGVMELSGMTDMTGLGDSDVVKEEKWEPTLGCMDPAADNYDPNADYDNGNFCEYPPILGCTDTNATNYDSMAEEDDGSCEYPPPVDCNVFFYETGLYWVDENHTGLDAYGDPDENNSCGDVPITLYFILEEVNGSNYYNTSLEKTINGEAWDDLWLTHDPLNNGTYNATIALYYWEDDDWVFAEEKKHYEIKVGD
tara:strand:+ start:83 stop:886 length:804 start_codon:yes stop_codon:yes gene_type:complete